MIKFLLMVNRQGQTRLSRYYQSVELCRRAQLEADAVRCCLSRRKDQVTEGLCAGITQGFLFFMLFMQHDEDEQK